MVIPACLHCVQVKHLMRDQKSMNWDITETFVDILHLYSGIGAFITDAFLNFPD